LGDFFVKNLLFYATGIFSVYFFLIKESFCLDAHFFPFLSRKKNKEIGERKKKKDRGQASACRQIWEYSA